MQFSLGVWDLLPVLFWKKMIINLYQSLQEKDRILGELEVNQDHLGEVLNQLEKFSKKLRKTTSPTRERYENIFRLKFVGYTTFCFIWSATQKIAIFRKLEYLP